MSLLSPGDHVVTGDDLYGGTHRLFDKVLPRSGGLDFTTLIPRMLPRSKKR